MDKSLKISEKLFCLAVNPRRGGILLNASSALSMTLAGSVFVELLKKELISLVRHKQEPVKQLLTDCQYYRQ